MSNPITIDGHPNLPALVRAYLIYLMGELLIPTDQYCLTFRVRPRLDGTHDVWLGLTAIGYTDQLFLPLQQVPEPHHSLFACTSNRLVATKPMSLCPLSCEGGQFLIEPYPQVQEDATGQGPRIGYMPATDDAAPLFSAESSPFVWHKRELGEPVGPLVDVAEGLARLKGLCPDDGSDVHTVLVSPGTRDGVPEEHRVLQGTIGVGHVAALHRLVAMLEQCFPEIKLAYQPFRWCMVATEGGLVSIPACTQRVIDDDGPYVQLGVKPSPGYDPGCGLLVPLPRTVVVPERGDVDAFLEMPLGWQARRFSLYNRIVESHMMFGWVEPGMGRVVPFTDKWLFEPDLDPRVSMWLGGYGEQVQIAGVRVGDVYSLAGDKPGVLKAPGGVWMGVLREPDTVLADRSPWWVQVVVEGALVREGNLKYRRVPMPVEAGAVVFTRGKDGADIGLQVEMLRYRVPNGLPVALFAVVPGQDQQLRLVYGVLRQWTPGMERTVDWYPVAIADSQTIASPVDVPAVVFSVDDVLAAEAGDGAITVTVGEDGQVSMNGVVPLDLNRLAMYGNTPFRDTDVPIPLWMPASPSQPLLAGLDDTQPGLGLDYR